MILKRECVSVVLILPAVFANKKHFMKWSPLRGSLCDAEANEGKINSGSFKLTRLLFSEAAALLVHF